MIDLLSVNPRCIESLFLHIKMPWVMLPILKNDADKEKKVFDGKINILRFMVRVIRLGLEKIDDFKRIYRT